MRLSDFDFALPPEMIAQAPARPRDAARLLVAVGSEAVHARIRDLPQVRRMYEVQRVLDKVAEFSDARSAYGRAVSLATVQQATRALAGLAALERMPFTLFPLHAA